MDRNTSPLLPQTVPDVRTVGSENEPVIVIDHASGDPASLVAAAVRSTLSPAASVGSGYPGLLAPAPVAYVDWMVRAALPLVARHFTARPVRPVRARGNFSLVTTPPDALTPDQAVPHVDAADRLQFAIVHFLSDDPDGTGFFRHRATGFETIDGERLPAYRDALDAERRVPRQGYVAGHDPHFELIADVPAARDRLILYRACLLHSGMISHVPHHAADPRLGRLTGNLFLQCGLA